MTRHPSPGSNSWGFVAGVLLGRLLLRARAWLHEMGARCLMVLLVTIWVLRRGRVG
jgi:hypothetical protein